MRSPARHVLTVICVLFCLADPVAAQQPARVDAELRQAVLRGDVAGLKRLLPASAAPDTLDALLLKASYYGPSSAVDFLLTRGAHGNAADADGWTALLAAVKGGQDEIADLLLAHGADAHTGPSRQNSCPLLQAARLGRIRILLRLLAAGVSPDEKPPGGDTPLIGALRSGQDTAFRTLLDHGATVDARGARGETPLLVALGQPESIAGSIPILLARRANPDLGDDYGNTPLLVAVRRGDSLRSKQLLNRGADLRSLDSYGYPALAYAIRTGQDAMALELLKRGASPTQAYGETRDTPLLLAARFRRTQLFGPLLEAGAETNQQNASGETALMLVMAYDRAAAGLLLQHGANWRLRDRKGRSALQYDHAGWLAKELKAQGVDVSADPAGRDQAALDETLSEACAHGDAEVVAAKLTEGANPRSEGSRWTIAAEQGYDDVLRALLDHEPILAFTQTATGMTPLMLAASSGHLSTVRLLLARAGYVRGQTKDGQSASDLAAKCGHLEIVEALETGSEEKMTVEVAAEKIAHGDLTAANAIIDKMGNVNAVGEDGDTLLFSAVTSVGKNPSGIVRRLLEKGADLGQLDRYGETPLTACLQSDRPDIADLVTLLVRGGAEVNHRNHQGCSPLLLACRRLRAEDRARLLKLLLDAGAQN